MPTTTNQKFKKTFKTKKGDVTVVLYDHSNWPPSGLGGIMYYTDYEISGPIGNRSGRLKYRDGNTSAGDDWSNNINSVISVKIEGNEYVLQTDKGERRF